jgi:hypothetical protein
LRLWSGVSPTTRRTSWPTAEAGDAVDFDFAVAASGESGDGGEFLGLGVALEGDEGAVEGVAAGGAAGGGFAGARVDRVEAARKPEDGLGGTGAAKHDAAARDADEVGNEVTAGREIDRAGGSGVDGGFDGLGVVGGAVADRAEIADVGRARELGDGTLALVITGVGKIGEPAGGGPFLAGLAPELGVGRGGGEEGGGDKKSDEGADDPRRGDCRFRGRHR